MNEPIKDSDDAVDEPPDPSKARAHLIHYLNIRSSGQQVNGEVWHYGSQVVADLKAQIPQLISHGDYARALENLANACYSGAGGHRELEEMLSNLEKELKSELTTKRANELRIGINLVNEALS